MILLRRTINLYQVLSTFVDLLSTRVTKFIAIIMLL